MANPTTNFGWVMPTSTSLVTNLPADFNTFGQAVDTSMSQLKGGSTGQVLSKTSATDMAFTWVTPTDQTPLTTKGDLFTFTTVDARLAVGNNGETLVADSSASTGLRYQSNFAAGKNAIINGAFNVWQRGTSFSNPSANTYTADRFLVSYDGTGATRTISQQAFTPATAPVAGYEGTYFLRSSVTAGGSGNTYTTIEQRIEDVRTFANQTATFSVWLKADSARTVYFQLFQVFGSGGSGVIGTGSLGNLSVTTSWQRFTMTVSIPSISGKTIGTGSNLAVVMYAPAGVATIDSWGWQLEAGSVATAFQTATGTIQGELAACRRYLPAINIAATGSATFIGYAYTTNSAIFPIAFDVPARVGPTGITTPTVNTTNFTVRNKTNGDATITSLTFDISGVNGATLLAGATLTAGDVSRLVVNNTSYILFTGCEL